MRQTLSNHKIDFPLGKAIILKYSGFLPCVHLVCKLLVFQIIKDWNFRKLQLYYDITVRRITLFIVLYKNAPLDSSIPNSGCLMTFELTFVYYLDLFIIFQECAQRSMISILYSILGGIFS